MMADFVHDVILSRPTLFTLEIVQFLSFLDAKERGFQCTREHVFACHVASARK